MEKNNKKNNVVFFVSIIIVFAIVAFAVFAPTIFSDVFNFIYQGSVNNFGWLYLASMFGFVVFVVFVGLSKWGKIRLGSDDSRPEYSNLSWFAMLFSAGMGIGLVFWGVAEPLNHFVNPIIGIESGTMEAAEFAMRKSFFHWGLQPWAGYCVIAMALAYMQFRKGKPGLISSIFIPLVGEEKAKGWFGKTVDILAVFATVAGVATSLGLGAMQINSGLNYMFGIPETMMVVTVIIAIITVIFLVSTLSGLDKGIKLLSNLNIAIAGLIMLAAFFVGPTVKMLNSFFTFSGEYVTQFITDSLTMPAFQADPWYGAWTIFYWAWWIAWAPFVGMFIARISKGRTIREFVLGVLVVPTLGSFIWFAIFGTLGMDLGLEVAKEAIASTSTAFFVVMSHYPLGTIISVIAILLLVTFFVTSANSATFVLAMMTHNGDLNPPSSKKFVWGMIQSALALVLIIAGGLNMLQTASIAAALPFIFVMILACVSLVKMFKSEK